MEKQRRWGQFYTAPEVVDLVLGFCLRRPDDRLLDPSCGEGAFLARASSYQRWLANSGLKDPGRTLWGVEIDTEAVAAARERLAADGDEFYPHLLVRDFFSLRPGEDPELPETFDCVVGNPPYTRSEWLGQVEGDPGYKQSLMDNATAGSDGKPIARLSRRAGLHAYFLVHAAKFLRPGGRFGFVVSNSWLDVDYGAGLKQFLLDRFKIVSIIESAVEHWFSDARVNTCLLILERCDDPPGRNLNRVRFARLRRPLAEFIELDPDGPGRAVEVEGLIMRLMPPRTRLAGDVSVRVVFQEELSAGDKWGAYLRAPEVFFSTRSRPTATNLGELVSLRRGQTTGANPFFYLGRQQVARWTVEPEYLRPLLKSPKEVGTIRVGPADLPQRALVVPDSRAALQGTNALHYVEWGESQGYHRRPTCARRPVWFSLPMHGGPGPHLAWPKGIWNRHFVLLLDGDVVVDQQFYELTAEPHLVRPLAAVLNSSWVALQTELLGRSNFGEGVLWLAGYELLTLSVPDLRPLSPAELGQLESALDKLVDAPLLPISEQVAQPARQALDAIVFDLLGLEVGERTAVVEAAVELADTRIRRATAG